MGTSTVAGGSVLTDGTPPSASNHQIHEAAGRSIRSNTSSGTPWTENMRGYHNEGGAPDETRVRKKLRDIDFDGLFRFGFGLICLILFHRLTEALIPLVSVAHVLAFIHLLIVLLFRCRFFRGKAGGCHRQKADTKPDSDNRTKRPLYGHSCSHLFLPQ